MLRLKSEVTKVAELPKGARPEPYKNLTDVQMDALAKAVKNNDFRVELRLGVNTGIGDERRSNSVLGKLREELKNSKEFGGKDVLDVQHPTNVKQHFVDAAETAHQADKETK